MMWPEAIVAIPAAVSTGLHSSEGGEIMAEQEDNVGVVADLLPLVARTIKKRLRQIEEVEAQTKTLSRSTRRERLELLRLGRETYQALLGMAVK